MKAIVARSITGALQNVPELEAFVADLPVIDTIERTRDAAHGDFASNIAMRLAKPARKSPRELAGLIVDALDTGDDIARVEVAGPGFINFYLEPVAFHREISTILDQEAGYGRQPRKDRPKILLEFVSANPTGPLHVGHGRHAAFGATVGNLLEAAGYPVHREYYVNDAGRQMDILGVSVLARLLESRGLEFAFPSAGYRGDYIRDIATDYPGEIPAITAEALTDGLPADGAGDDKAAKEAYVEALIARARELLGEAGFGALRQYSLEAIRADIEADLAEFGVVYDEWFSEQSLEKNGRIDAALAVLEERGMLYRKDGATWFPATRFGDEKDRVVVRENGVKTYFASDIAYHFDKRERGYDHLIDILGADTAQIASAPVLVAEPRFRSPPTPPVYPPASRRRHEEGIVVLRALVSPSGRTEEVAVHRSSGFHRLDEAARLAVLDWRFEPARRAAVPVASWVEVPVRFHLN